MLDIEPVSQHELALKLTIQSVIEHTEFYPPTFVCVLGFDH